MNVCIGVKLVDIDACAVLFVAVMVIAVFTKVVVSELDFRCLSSALRANRILYLRPGRNEYVVPFIGGCDNGDRGRFLALREIVHDVNKRFAIVAIPSRLYLRSFHIALFDIAQYPATMRTLQAFDPGGVII